MNIKKLLLLTLAFALASSCRPGLNLAYSCHCEDPQRSCRPGLNLAYNWRAICNFFVTPAYAADKGNPPVAHWRFDEGGGPTAYDEIGANDGALNANTGGTNTAAGQMWTTQGKISGALELDGTDDRINMGDPVSGDLDVGTGDFTIEAWVKTNGAVTSIKGIAVKGSCGAVGYGMLLLSPGKPNFAIQATANTHITANSEVDDGNWHHIAMAADRDGSVYIYIDGVVDKTADISGQSGTLDNGSNFVVGAYSSQAEYWFNGNIDDLRLYKYLRTEAQIKQDYNNGMAVRLATGTDPNEGNPPVLYFSFDEASGTTIYDRSGNNNNGALDSGSFVQGKYGRCIKFSADGNEVTVQPSSTINFGSSDFSVVSWVNIPKPENYGSGIFGRYAHNTDYNGCFVVGILDNMTDLFMHHRNTTGGYSSWSFNYSLYFSKWTHMAWVKSGTKLYLYLNGELKQSWTPSFSFDVTFANYNYQISNTGWSPGVMTNLMVDEHKIYNYARTAAQVAYDYNKGAPVAHYKFDEGTGTIAHNEYSTAGSGAAPIGWWRMDNDWTDSSGNGLTGTATGATFSSSSKIGPYCGNFSADNVSVGSFSGYSNSVTAQAWIKRGSGYTGWNDIFCGPSGDIIFAVIGDKLVLGAQGNSPIAHDTLSTTLLNDDVWHHVTGTYDGSTVKIYVDGVLENQSSKSGSYTPGAKYIGSNSGGSSEYFYGFIDDVRIYNYARTAEQIYNDYKSTHGTMVGDTKFVDGKLGKALSFDGTGDYVDCGTDANLDLPQQFTLEGWVKSADFSSRGALVYKGHPTTNGWSVYGLWVGSTGNLYFFISSGGSAEDVTASNFLTEDAWYHVAAVQDSTHRRIYVNGVEKANEAGVLTPGVSSDHLWIGNTDTDGIFNGKLDDVRIYNYARTQAQIAEDYANGAARLGAQAAGEADPWGGALPVAHLKLDENTGVIARDASENNNNGAITGATWTQGKLGPCLSFSSSSSTNVRGTISPAIAASADYTQAAWIYPTAAVAGSVIDDYNNAEHYIIRNSNGTIRVNYYDNPGTPTHVWAESTKTAPLNQWTHVAGVVDSGNSIKVYINGVLAAENSSLSIQSKILNDFVLGQWGGGSQKFEGKIDDARVYNYALTQAQVSWLYNKGKPVGHWRFNESSGTDAWDESGNNNATVTIGATGSQTTIAAARTAGATGKFGRCLSLDGTDDYVDCGSDASLVMGTGDFTIEAWINSDVLYGPTWSDPVGCIVQTRDLNSGSAQDGYYLGIAVSTIFFQIGDGTVNNGDFRVSYTDIGNWHHVVATRDAGSLFKLYLDGEFKGQDSDPCGDVGNTTNFHIGSRNAGSHFWDGLIDDVRVYNYVRTTAQIKEDYNNGLAARLGD